MSQPDPALRPSRVLTLVPLLIVATGLVVMLKRFAQPVDNPDTFFHLRLGREFLDGWAPWSPGSVTRYATADWAPTQWLSQVVYAAVEGWLGLPGVAWLSGTVVVAFVVTCAVVAHRIGGLVVAALVSTLALFASAPFLSARPQVLSYLFLVLVTAAWLRTGRGGPVPWWTVPLTWLWAMVHGMWLSGVVIGLVAALGLTLDRRTRPTPPRHPVWHPWLVPLLSLVAAGLTPVGPALLTATFRVGAISTYFAEWRATEFTSPTTATAAVMLGLVLLVGLRRGAQPWLELLLTALAAAWMLYAQRSVPVGVAMLVPLLASALGSLVPPRESAGWERRTLVGLGVAASALLAALVPFTSTDLPRAGDAPSAAVADLPAGTALLNDWGLGGTDMWLYPHLDLVMHGYGDMFTDEELERNSGLGDLEPGWDDTLRDLEVTRALLVTDTPLAYALVGAGWQVVAEDDELSHLVAPDDWLTGSAG